MDNTPLQRIDDGMPFLRNANGTYSVYTGVKDNMAHQYSYGRLMDTHCFRYGIVIEKGYDDEKGNYEEIIFERRKGEGRKKFYKLANREGEDMAENGEVSLDF